MSTENDYKDYKDVGQKRYRLLFLKELNGHTVKRCNWLPTILTLIQIVNTSLLSTTDFFIQKTYGKYVPNDAPVATEFYGLAAMIP